MLIIVGCGEDPATECRFDAHCPAGERCEMSACVPLECTRGSEGCGCLADRCGNGVTGESLYCEDDRCRSERCSPGSAGCTCLEDTCEAGAHCRTGFCLVDDCVPGQEMCGCTDSTQCEPDLYCFDGAVCISNEGRPGGPCLEDDRCFWGAECEGTVCIPCPAGELGCACESEGVCGDGLACLTNHCLDPSDTASVARRVECYVPCRDSLDTRVCDSDGLLEGCLSAQECAFGSCGEPGHMGRVCEYDVDCPIFQSCLQDEGDGAFRCYSDCVSDTECAAGFLCDQRVCRVPCRRGGFECGDGLHCEATLGDRGICRPDTPAVGASPPSEETVRLPLRSSPSIVLLTPASHEGSVNFGGLSAADGRLTVTKRWHRRTGAGGVSERRTVLDGEPIAPWLNLRSQDGPPGETATLECVDGQCETLLVFDRGASASRWEVMLDVDSPAGHTEVLISYAEQPEGQWAGSMFTFANFGEEGVSEWAASSDRSNVSAVANGLIRRWGAFRGGRLSGGWHEMQAVLTSARTGTWDSPEIESRCSVGGGACYPYGEGTGVRPFTTSRLDAPIPSAVAELPFVLDLFPESDTSLLGVVESTGTLHYPGRPAAYLELESDPSQPGACDPAYLPDSCVVWIASFEVESVIGAQILPEGLADGGVCPSDLIAARVPDLLEGWSSSTMRCVDASVPLNDESRNRNLARANPSADGIRRHRALHLLDGALIDQRTLVILYREVMTGLLGEATSYGTMVLRLVGTELDDTDEMAPAGVPDVYQGRVFEGRAPLDTEPRGCEGQLIADLTPHAFSTALSIRNLAQSEIAGFVDVLIEGTAVLPGASEIPRTSVHVYCEDTGLIDGGAESAVLVPCPVGSRVHFFSAPSLSPGAIARDACQSPVVCEEDDLSAECGRGTCFTRLEAWLSAGIVDVDRPSHVCTGGLVLCDDDRHDLRTDKRFFAPMVVGGPSLRPLAAEVESAFRYRTRFSTSGGRRVGFAPAPCPAGSDQVPYCYDVSEVGSARTRVDCLLEIYASELAMTGLTASSCTSGRCSTVLELALRTAFGQDSRESDGFESLNAELLVMLGDEALTRAFSSRFDLAAVRGESFAGAEFENDGIDLSGVNGYSFTNLYRAVQYYDLALQRFYQHAESMRVAFGRAATVDSARVFVSATSATSYFERLLGAASQKLRAVAAIASRYTTLGRSDIARSVIERAYVESGYEQAFIVEILGRVVAASSRSDRTQIERIRARAQRRLQLGRATLRGAYVNAQTGDLNVFGLSDNYVPFPLLDASARAPDGRGPARNVFEFLLDRAKQRRDGAGEREQGALRQNRDFETGSAAFQAELTRVRIRYESELGALCGLFLSPVDGRTYPAIAHYAALHPSATAFGDPCGRLGGGAVHEEIAAYEQALLDQQSILASTERLLGQVELERVRASAQCEESLEFSDYQFRRADRVTDLRSSINTVVATQQLVATEINAGVQLIGLMQGAAAGVRAAATAGIGVNSWFAADRIRDAQVSAADIQRDTAHWQSARRCEATLIDSNASTAEVLLELETQALEALRAAWHTRSTLANIAALGEQAQRLESQLAESLSLLIDVEAARNDPNVRVYRNEAVLNADFSFNDARRATFEATRAFEHYTSQSYAGRGSLALVTAVSIGDANLDNYLLALENAFFSFEEDYGARRRGLLIISLRDDILNIPQLDELGLPLSLAERQSRLAETLLGPSLRDASGALAAGFSIDLSQLPQDTVSHQIERIEVEIAGSGGDHVAQVRLTQLGTGTLQILAGDRSFLVSEPRSSIVNVFFNGNRIAPPEFYQDTRFAGRAVVNGHWKLVLDTHNTRENRDIDIGSITDIRLFFYYTDIIQ